MKVMLFGATGMVGAGALRETLADPGVEAVLSVGRRSCAVQHPKLRELLLTDLFEFANVESQLAGWDACIWAVGISSARPRRSGVRQGDRGTDAPLGPALLGLNPGFSFCYCSAMGAGGRAMWARVRRRVEGGLKAMPFRHAGCVRPGFIQPGPGIRSNVKLYQTLIVFGTPLFPVFVKTLPSLFTTSERLGRAMLRVVQGRADRFILESADINRIGS